MCSAGPVAPPIVVLASAALRYTYAGFVRVAAVRRMVSVAARSTSDVPPDVTCSVAGAAVLNAPGPGSDETGIAAGNVTPGTPSSDTTPLAVPRMPAES